MDGWNALSVFVKITQRLLADTVSLTAPINWSMEGDGMHILSAPCLIRPAFWSARNRRIRPSCVLLAFMPSNMPWIVNTF